MQSDLQSSIVTLVTQTVAIGLVTVVSYLLSRSIRRTSLRYWTAGWLCLSIALVAQLAATSTSGGGFPLGALSLLGEYAFAFLFIAGCRNHAAGFRLGRKDLWTLVPGVAIAAALTEAGRGDFSIILLPHSLFLATLFGAAYRALRPARAGGASTPGVRVMSAALISLTIVALHYVAISIFVMVKHHPLPTAYLQYQPVYDLALRVLLGFGTVMQVMEDVARELEWSNRQLVSARDHMETLARVDPLTETLNRHGLALFLEQHERAPVAGSLALVDMDELKKINDTHGHAAGDAAIRSVATAIRSLIRADDLLIRWGGDEFLIILFGVTEADARRRLDALAPLISAATLPGVIQPVHLTVSWGIAPFTAEASLDAAIETADNAMYAEKQRRRRSLLGEAAGKTIVSEGDVAL